MLPDSGELWGPVAIGAVVTLLNLRRRRRRADRDEAFRRLRVPWKTRRETHARRPAAGIGVASRYLTPTPRGSPGVDKGRAGRAPISPVLKTS